MNYEDELEDVIIYEEEVKGHPIKMYFMGGGLQSASFVEEGKHFDLLFPYMEHFHRVFSWKKEIKKVLLLGTGVYTFPKYLISHHEDLVVEVVDIDPSVEETARRYFYLDELETKYNLKENKRLQTHIIDARSYLKYTLEVYDAIFDDAFIGQVPAFSLLTIEAAKLVYEKLKEDGIYVVNLPGYEDSTESKLLAEVNNTFQQVFPYVYFVSATVENHIFSTSNYVMFASKKELDVKDAIVVEKSEVIYYDRDIERLKNEDF